ncbi:MAG: hypothetical protein ACK55Z_25905, partial [bacterium]
MEGSIFGGPYISGGPYIFGGPISVFGGPYIFGGLYLSGGLYLFEDYPDTSIPAASKMAPLIFRDQNYVSR